MAEQVGALIGGADVLRNALVAVDANAPDTEAFKNAVAKKLCLGGGAAYLKGSFSDAADTCTVALCYYDINDTYLGMTRRALAPQALPVIDGRFESDMTPLSLAGAYAFRVALPVFTAAGNLNIVGGFLDGVPLR